MPATPHRAIKKIAFKHLARDLAALTQEELTRPVARLERVEALWLLLLGGRRAGGPALKRQAPFKHYSDGFLENLLFRDFSPGWQAWDGPQQFYEFGRWQLHAEAATYVSELLWSRTLQLARKIGQTPTNPHRLLQALCRLSAAPGEWAQTCVGRGRSGRRACLGWFEAVRDALQEHGRQARSSVSANATLRFGPYWLSAGECAETVGDELSVKDVLAIAPKPLREDFAADRDFLKLLQAVVESLNRPYALLRACGLPPAQWLKRLDDPQYRGLSFDKLRALGRLRAAFAALLEEAREEHEARRLADRPSAWQDGPGERERLFRLAFERQAAGGKIAGFAGFEGFAASPVGQEMLERAGVHAWPAQYFEEGAHKPAPEEPPADGDEELEEEGFEFDLSEEDEAYLAFLLEQGEIPLCERRPLLHRFLRAYADDALEALAADPAFRALQADDPRCAGLSGAALGRRLVLDGKLLALDVLLGPEPAHPPHVLAYIRWAMIEEKPVLGEGGLFAQPDFQALLAGHAPALARLPPPQLAERLRREALAALDALRGFAAD